MEKMVLLRLMSHAESTPKRFHCEVCHSGKTLKSLIPGPGSGAGMVREQSCYYYFYIFYIIISIIKMCAHNHTPSDKQLVELKQLNFCLLT